MALLKAQVELAFAHIPVNVPQPASGTCFPSGEWNKFHFCLNRSKTFSSTLCLGLVSGEGHVSIFPLPAQWHTCLICGLDVGFSTGVGSPSPNQAPRHPNHGGCYERQLGQG